MADMMTFPDTWEEYEKIYGFTDREQIYTNGARLIPSFRVEQWLDHIAQFLNECSELYAEQKNVPRCDECIHFDRPYRKIGKDGILEIGVECDGAESVCDKFSTTDCAWK